MPIGLTLPFAQTTSSLGVLAFSVNELQATYYNLKSLLLTNWGERPNHFFLGGNLIEFVFNPATDETFEQIRSRIDSQVATWLPFVHVDSTQIVFDEAVENKLNVRIEFSLRGRPDLRSVLDVSVQG